MAAAALAAGVAIAVALGVIPLMRERWTPHVQDAEGAVPAFWVSVGTNVTFAAVLVASAMCY
ncbi:MAG: hypothetical protein FJ035_01875 [Chloroflexi bacterium]|nr:hypothetical protein [Chloroflexota bacterium]